VLRGKVDYLDPLVSPDTRTARLRVEVENPGQKLRLGMYAEMTIAGDAAAALVVPRSAVQSFGNRHVVYIVDPNQSGVFIEREVQLGPTVGDEVPIASGLVAGDVVVDRGTFYLRAERERLGLRGGAGAGHVQHGGALGEPEVQRVRVTLGEGGYDPATVNLKAGIAAQVTFVRTTDKTCGTEIVLPDLGMRKELPLNELVIVELPPDRTGQIAFGCGMGMLEGRIVIETIR
jgi:hypothetical protein